MSAQWQWSQSAVADQEERAGSQADNWEVNWSQWQGVSIGKVWPELGRDQDQGLSK